MLEVETLRIADTYEWLGTGLAAGTFLRRDQSTVSRTVRRVKRLRNTLASTGALDLLDKEREIHQRWRFKQGTNLRIHAYQWTNQLIHNRIPDSWDANPLMVSETKRPGLLALEQRIIDALCAPFPLIANADSEIFAALPLYTTHLRILVDKRSHLAREYNLSVTDIAASTQLSILDYVPLEATRCSEEIDIILFQANQPEAEQVALESRYWGTPLTPMISSNLLPLSCSIMYPYAEFLVVLKEWENHPLVSELLEKIWMELRQGVAHTPTSEFIRIAA